MINQEPIFVFGAHKSGTTLLRSLLDGHLELFVIPIETHFFQIMKYWVDNEYRKQRPRRVSREKIIYNLCDWIHKYNEGRAQFSDTPHGDMFNEDVFRSSIADLTYSHRDKEIIELYFSSIYKSIYNHNLPQSKRVVEKSVENAEFAFELQKIFPDAKFLHIIRNPYSNIVSLRRYKESNFEFPLMRRILKTLYNSYYFLYKNSNIIQNYKIIKYEDLVKNPETEIQKIVDYLQLSWENSLLTPTVLGQEWEGNSTTGEKFSGISTSRITKWQSEIHPMEIYYINRLFPFVLKDFNYERIERSRTFWRPAAGENLKRYLANRMYRYFLVD